MTVLSEPSPVLVPVPIETPETTPAETAAVDAAPVDEPAAAALPAAVESGTVVAGSGAAPYRVIDGRIDPDTVEGWKVYRGIGTCATCHGPVGQGGVGPPLIESLKEKISRETFAEVVANGRSGTMMKPFRTNKSVMDKLDNIYAYLKARADGVLGPGNLIRSPLGWE
jgi:mono/diheme cytochrome c family protein